jgi:hypothetical protein
LQPPFAPAKKKPFEKKGFEFPGNSVAGHSTCLIASLGHTSAQAPQSVHSSALIT